MVEEIICFEAQILNKYLNRSVVFYDKQLWHDILNSLQNMPRSAIENDCRFKQLIVYVIIKSQNLYLTYKRTEKTGESRLRKKYSLGIGGHVNVVDRSQLTLFDNKNKRDFILQAVWREITEETKINSNIIKGPQLVYFINDDSNKVGRVHFGTVWLLEIHTPNVSGKTGEGIGRLKFYDLYHLKTKKHHFEKWSQLLIDYFIKKEDKDVIIDR